MTRYGVLLVRNVPETNYVVVEAEQEDDAVSRALETAGQNGSNLLGWTRAVENASIDGARIVERLTEASASDDSPPAATTAITFLDGNLCIDSDDEGAMTFLHQVSHNVCENCPHEKVSTESEQCRRCYNAAIYGMESLLLALVSAGVIATKEDPDVNRAIRWCMSDCEFYSWVR